MMDIELDPTFTQVLLLLTNRCNLSCKHCYVSSEPGGAYGLQKERVLAFIDEIHDELGKVLISISGGEPLSRREDCLQILEYASQKLEVRLLSNCTLITPEIAKRLARMNISIRVSIDGGDITSHDFMRGDGAFEKTCKGLRNLLDAGFPPADLQIYATIVFGGVDQISKIIAFAESFGITRIKFETLALDGRALQYWNNESVEYSHVPYLQFFQNEFPADYGTSWDIEDMTPYDLSFTTLTTYYNGDTYPYTFTNDMDREMGYLGNINTQSLNSIVTGSRLPEAIIKKFILIARGPKRSLQAYWLTKKQ